MDLKKIFIPSEKNDYKPHILRELSLAIFSFLAIFVFFVGILHITVLKGTDLLSAVVSRTLVELTNNDRTNGKIGLLTVSPTLELVAQLKANDMAENGYFAHVSPQGKNPWYWFKYAGYDFVYAGENLAVNFSDSSEVDRAWMNSPGHRENILNGKYTEIGIATANGMYQGRPTTFVVQMFARPMTDEQKAVLAQVNKALVQKSPSVVTTKNSKPKAVSTNATTSTSTITQVEHKVLGTETFAEIENVPVLADPNPTPSEIKKVSFIDTLLANPKQNLSFVYLSIALFLFVCLLLMVLIQIRTQHPRLVVLSIMVIGFILILLFLFRDVITSQVIVL